MLLTNISPLEILSLIGILHCFVLSLIILFSKFFRSPANSYLGYTLFIIAVVGINNWIWDLGLNPQLINILDTPLWQFLYPVSLFLFFYKTSKQPIIPYNKVKLLFLPFVLLSILNTIIYLSIIFRVYQLPVALRNYIPLFYKCISFLSIIFPIITTVLSYKQIVNNKDQAVKKWLLYLFSFFLILELYGIILEAHRFIFSERLALTYLWTLASIFIYWLIYKGLYQFKLSNDQYEIRTITKKQSATSTQLTSNKNIYFQKLVQLLTEEKIHHNPNLSRDTVAEQLGISTSYLSQILKENTNSSFSEFINSYRINDIKKMIKDPQFEKYSLLAIGLECGFNSKTSFYTNFKKQTGLTPKEYKEK